MEVAEQLRNFFLDEVQDRKEVSIFLCGGSSSEETRFRRDVGDGISGIVSKYRYSIYYPEDMFIELILGHQKHDLLTLENLLANGVDAVVILLQSPGTFTELGAFTNHEKLRDKLIVVINPKFARAKSFINLGPIRYLRTKTKSRVLDLSMESSNLEAVVKQIADASRAVAQHATPIRDLSNPISAYRFYLALIYVFEPIPRAAIIEISSKLANTEEKTVATAAETAINSLVGERKVSLNSGVLSTTLAGIENLMYANKTQKSARILSSFLTELRLGALNLTLRKNYRRIWGETK